MIEDISRIMTENKIIETSRLILRPFYISDTEDVFIYASDDQVTKYLTWDTHKNISETEKVVREFYTDNPGIFAIELESENKCIGCIDLRIYEEHDKASFGFVLNRDYWNKGYMTEALDAILSFGFKKLELNRIESTHYRGNEGSGAVMKKCGMSYEGTGIQEVKFKEIYQDVFHYAILQKDWENNSEK